jgi:hypothetical protein
MRIACLVWLGVTMASGSAGAARMSKAAQTDHITVYMVHRGAPGEWRYLVGPARKGRASWQARNSYGVPTARGEIDVDTGAVSVYSGEQAKRRDEAVKQLKQARLAKRRSRLESLRARIEKAAQALTRAELALDLIAPDALAEAQPQE